MAEKDEGPIEDVEEGERPRPRVVDKRISARIARGEDISAPPAKPQPARDAGDEPAAQEEPAPATAPTGAEAPGPPVPEGPVAPSGPAGPGRGGVWTPEQEAEAMRIAQEIAQIPSVDWVAQTAVSLANVAGTKLELGQTADAQLAIDALAGLLNSVGARLGSAEPVLRQTLAQLQMAYAQRAAPPPSTPGESTS
ncbi:MAG: hypothetical protein ABR505_07675 [Actinomycetota bacterium]